MKNTWLAVTLTVMSLAVISAGVAAQRTGRDRVLTVDAVELIDHGREVEGKVEHQHRHGRYNYLFANADTLKTFQADPARYEIQLGGACARMGPLTGEGSPKLFAVHDGRLYIFASEKCRRTFLDGPQKLLASDEPAPAVTSQSAKRGRELLDRAVAGLGGAARLDSIVSYREGLSRTTESGGKTYVVTNTVTLLLPDGIRSDSCWNESCWGNVLAGPEGWKLESNSADAETMVDVERAALRRGDGRHPLTLLRARSNPEVMVTSASTKRTIEIAGEGPIELELFSMHLDGATTTLGIDSAGRVRLLSFRDRGPTLAFGQIEKVYSAFHDVGGLMLPGRVDVAFEGQPAADLSGAFAIQTVNDAADKALFQRPATVSN